MALTAADRRFTAFALATGMLAAGCGQPARPTVSPTAPARAERELASDLNRVFAAPIMGQALWGVEVKSLDSGRVLYERNARTLMTPASNMKIVTLAAAAETLGWDYRFTTVLETAAPVRDGVLEGDLIVRGSGDPSINARDGRAAKTFDDWAAALKAAGITRIDGNVVGDDNAFDDETLGAGWAWDYLQYGYAAPIGALEYNEDTAELVVKPGAAAGDPVFLELTPGAGLQVVNRAATGPTGAANTIDYRLHPHERVLEVTGSLALDAKTLSEGVAVVNPTMFFAQGLRDALVAHEIDVTGVAEDADDVLTTPSRDSRRVLVATQSPPLRDIAVVMMKVSQNLYAETLLKAVGAASGGLGTTEGGRTVARAMFASWGIPPETYVQLDGSGLSRYDYVTADMLVTILERLYRDPKHHDAFVATLPVAGRDGTLRSRLKNTRAEGNATAKTGSIANVRTLSGYVKARNGERLAFSILANNFTIPAAVVNWIADLAVEILSNY